MQTIVEPQVEIEAYISNVGNLCIAVRYEDLIEIENKQVLIINTQNIENFILNLHKLSQEAKEVVNGLV